ncbi:MAG: M20/M25/M40 family metallo-hydrolase [Planctomycetota bacterium]|jgi:carboxypeptidase PM20D1
MRRKTHVRASQLLFPPSRPERVGCGTVEKTEAVKRLAGAIRFQTLSHPDPMKFNPYEFLGFRSYLEKAFPKVHETLGREIIGDFSLLYTWRGSRPHLAPVLLSAHMDVVPISPETESKWTHPPFDGVVSQGFIWGRGTLDDKASMMGILEGVESLRVSGFKPRRTILLAFGHDEEVGGEGGAARMASCLESRGVRPAFVLEESGAVTEGIVPKMPSPVALVGIAEKGYLDLELSVEEDGFGDSSLPPSRSPIGRLGAAIDRLEKNPFPAVWHGVAEKMLRSLRPRLNTFQRIGFGLRRIFPPWILRTLEGAPQMDATLRTTVAATRIQAGERENLLPSRAEAMVNLRLRPGESIPEAIRRVEKIVADPGVKVRIAGQVPSEASSISETDTWGWRILEKSIHRRFSGAPVVPYLVLGSTDARHYQGICRHIYRFLPIRIRPEDLKLPHGTDERIGVGAYANMVGFYAGFLREAGSDTQGTDAS